MEFKGLTIWALVFISLLVCHKVKSIHKLLEMIHCLQKTSEQQWAVMVLLSTLAGL